ncbi:MAG TPA: mechanosensitive ion channel domain-containing protein [Sphingomonas sp.]|nr:mechanosensitive ion channel domain-containing protein [Sphingomonas sp.]
MNGLDRWLTANGIVLPTGTVLIEAAIAFGLALASLALGYAAGRTIGPRLATFWTQHVGGHAEGLGPRMGVILRYLVAFVLLAIVFRSPHVWHTPASIVLGLALGSTAALLARQILRGLNLPRWMAWLVATVLFVALLSNAVGGLDRITGTLDLVGFNLGKHRFSLMALVTILVTFVALFAGFRLANRVLSHSIGQARSLDPTQKLLAQKLAAITVIVVAFFFGIDLLGIDLTTFAVFSGAFGLAVGFGLQKTIGNLIAGIILLMDRSIKPGDVIVVGDSFGWVNKIGVRAVSVLTRDGKEHLIPNENLMTQEVENWSYSDRNVRVRIPARVSYKSDLKRAQELMMRAAVESPRTLDSPKPNVRLTAFGESAVEHEILVWISDPEGGVGSVRSDVLNRLWVLFKDEGIEIPLAQQDVYLHRDQG